MRSRFEISAWHLIVFFAATKLILHLLTFDNFELHRDAYLYYAQSENLAWGYIAVPPLTAVVGKLATLIFGNTVFGLRFFPALVGALSLLVVGLATIELGGKRIAVAIACLAYLLSPSYLHTNFLYQPVAFNHFYWILFSYLFLRLIIREDPQMWIWIAVVFGLGMLNKYSMVFVGAAFALALLISPRRSLYLSRYFLIALGIGLLIVLPNMIWQYQHNWPVLEHMGQLREMQLVHVRYSDFLKAQLLMNVHAILVWSLGVVAVLVLRKERQFALFGWAFVILMVILLAGSGKPYYTLGIYPIFFVFGGHFIEKYAGSLARLVFAVLIPFMLISLYFSQSFDGIPFSSPDRIASKEAFRWEDGINHDIPQDMADMRGWKEIAMSVRDIYLELGPDNENNCDIYCYHYGQAGALMFYGEDVDIPMPISPNGSFVFWAPDSLSKDYMIYVHSDLNNDVDPDKRLPQLFESVTLMKTIDDPYFREDGTRIYLCKYPNDAARDFYKGMIKDLKDKYR